MQPTHYAALGVEPGAEVEEVRRAYKAAALRTHPDKAAGGAAPAEYLRVQAAWEALADPARRAAYDRHLALEAARQEVAVSETVGLAEMGEASVEGQAFRSWPCRCGGAYLLPAAEAAAAGAGSQELLVPCTTCSLYIRAVG